MPKNPCVPCKELLDGGRALQRATGCMANSVLLVAAAGGKEPDAALVAEFLSLAEKLAIVASKIEEQVSG